jgi:GntR family transcriptional regulator
MGARFVPRYYEIEQELRARVARSQPGDPVPSDAQVCAEFGVSRMTARHAIDQLRLEGLVRRVPGRGTFVAERRTHRQAGNLLSFSEEMRRRGIEARSRVVEHVVREPSEAEARRLGIARGELVVALTRVRIGDGRPVALETAVLPGACAAALDGSELEHGSLHKALVAAGRVPTAGRGSIRSEAAGARDAELLDVPPGSPLLVEERLIVDQHRRPVELTESRYAGDRYSLEVEFDVELAGRGSQTM